jgi:hypothetical protein
MTTPRCGNGEPHAAHHSVNRFGVGVTCPGMTTPQTDREQVIKERVEDALAVAEETTSSDDALVQLAWLIDGLDVRHRSGGTVGNTLDETKLAVLSRHARLLVEVQELQAAATAINDLYVAAETELGLLRGRATNTEELAKALDDATAAIGMGRVDPHDRDDIARALSAFLLAPTTEKEKES